MRLIEPGIDLWRPKEARPQPLVSRGLPLPTWIAVVLGILGGVVAIGGAVALAIRTESKPRKSWLPKADQQHRPSDYT
jgi:uncharacterized membrane protein YagU involved in acid resistance